MNIMTRKEFNELAIKNNWETFTQRQVYQFSQDILKSIDLIEREHGAIDFISLNRQEVVNDDFSKSIVYWREQQVEWDKAEDGILMKARSGVYKDTLVNRKKGIVGMRYGQERKEDNSKSKLTVKKVNEILDRTMNKKKEGYFGKIPRELLSHASKNNNGEIEIYFGRFKDEKKAIDFLEKEEGLKITKKDGVYVVETGYNQKKENDIKSLNYKNNLLNN